jgi:hypothetical protein
MFSSPRAVDVCRARSQPNVARRHRIVIALTILAACSSLVWAEEANEEAQKPAIEAPSPDGQFAFRYTGSSDDEPKTFDLIEKASGKVVQTIAEAASDPGPSERFNMEVLWRADSNAFAVTGTLWKRGSFVEVFMREGATFREIKVPELLADIPDKIMGGKSYHKVGQSNSVSAKRWQKDGSLVVQIETTLNGDDGSLTATRTVVLGFDRSDKARVLKSSIKFTREKP